MGEWEERVIEKQKNEITLALELFSHEGYG
jgi:hypothetical protein